MIIFTLAYLFFIILILNLLVIIETRKWIFTLERLPILRFALVLGAGLERDGQPTDILADRVLSAVKLVKSGKVDELIMSGSAKNSGYNEVIAMKQLAVAGGVGSSEIDLDDRGNSTLDSLINFINTFSDKEVVIITQPFHLPRALWLAKHLGLTGYGYPAHFYQFSWLKRTYWHLREILAMPFNLIKLVIYKLLTKNRTI